MLCAAPENQQEDVCGIWGLYRGEEQELPV